jgi:hypothetical protein
MEIRESDKVCIYTPLAPRLNAYECSRLFPSLASENKTIALDLSFVQDCTIEFIEALKNLASCRDIGVFNIQSDMFALFNLMNVDKTVRLFVSESDFYENSRRLINRKFSIV